VAPYENKQNATVAPYENAYQDKNILFCDNLWSANMEGYYYSEIYVKMPLIIKLSHNGVMSYDAAVAVCRYQFGKTGPQTFYPTVC